jgi:hypothetical protein
VPGIPSTQAGTGAGCGTNGPCIGWNGHWALGPAQYACWRPGHRVKWIFHLYPSPSDPLDTYALSFALHNLRIVGKSGRGTLTTSNGKPTIVIKNINRGVTLSVVMYVNRNAVHQTYFIAEATATSHSGKRRDKILMLLPRRDCS